MEPTHDKEMLELQRQVKRGITIMAKVYAARSEGRKLPVAWNEIGQPIEPGKDYFVSFIGKIARDQIPITLKHFKYFPREKKEEIWDEKRTFDIGPDRKKYVLQKVAELARNFRTSLKRKFLHDRDGNILLDPPALYDSINVDDWKEFVRQRTSKEFEALSVSQRKRALDPQYPYRGSRRGFARMEQIEVEKRRAAGLETTSLSRAELWKLSRSNKNGEIDNPAVQSVIENMESISQSNPALSADSNTRQDVLALALNKPEHGGRVRGIGFGVNQRQYFKESTGKQKDQKITALERQMKELSQRLDAFIASPQVGVVSQQSQAQFAPQQSQAGPDVSQRDSCSPSLPEAPAAPATKLPQSKTTASKSVGQTEDPLKDLDCKGLNKKMGALVAYAQQVMSSNDLILVRIDQEIMGDEFTEMIGREEISHVIKKVELTASVITTYIKYLWTGMSEGRRSEFGFLSPHQTAGGVNMDPKEQANYVGRFMATRWEASMFLALYISGGHWMLLAVVPSQGIIYYLDSLHGFPEHRKDMQDLFARAFKIYRTLTGQTGPSKIDWKRVKVPMQPNSVECGFYVMRSMKEIISHGQTQIPPQYFEDCRLQNYTDEKIDEIRCEWSQFVLAKATDE